DQVGRPVTDEGDACVVEPVEEGAGFGFVADLAELGQLHRGPPGAEEYGRGAGGRPPALVEGQRRWSLDLGAGVVPCA
ncbi:MAG: hypothetical protein ACK559_13400, partial [bacterium]